MDNQLIKKTNDSLIFTLQRQNEQGEALVQVLNQVTEIANRMDQQEQRVDKRIDEAEALLDKMSTQVTVTYEEQKNIASMVSRIATYCTKEHERREQTQFSNNLFKAWKGRFISRIYSKLKARMDAVRYTSIRRVDYQEALDFLTTITYVSFSKSELEPTLGILKILEMEEAK